MLNIVQKIIGHPWIPGYRIQERLFSGGFSEIYRAVQKRQDRTVALKILNEEGVKIASLMEKDGTTRWEAEILSTLDHPHIIRCLEYGRRGPYYWLALEFVESLIENHVGTCRSPEDETRMIELFLQLLGAVSYLHQKGYVHRDICLGNILVTADGQVKLIDFGLAVPHGSSVTQGKAGTPSYMAPELIRSSRHSVQSDIYSLGVVMYEMMTRRKPFRGQDAQAKMVRSLNVRPVPPSSVEGVSISPDLEQIILRAMEKDPADRFQSVKDMENALIVVRHRRARDLPAETA
jgi:serine/threonine-protein kinase